MITAFNLLGLALGVGFAISAPVFFTSVAEWNASLGYPELKRFLQKLFKIGFWLFLVTSIANLAALPFLNEERAEIAFDAVTSATLAWRFWRTLKKVPIQPPHTTTGSSAPDRVGVQSFGK